MRLCTLNIRHGGGKRVDSIVSFLGKFGADVVVLTEYKENSNAPLLKTRLFEMGYKWQASSSIASNENSVFLASRVPFISNCQFGILGGHAHRLLFARFSQFNLIGVYFPQNEAKRPVFDFLQSQWAALLGESGVIIGDFNTGKPNIDETGNTFACADCFGELGKSGLVDSWRSRNPETREFSWFSSAKNGFRIDHIFCTVSLDKRVTRIDYLHGAREEKATDHSAMLVEIDC
jgi:exodeoxyribonuclease III